MPGWGKTPDQNKAGNINIGANNAPFRYKGGTAPEKASLLAEKRNVIITNVGYVRRVHKTDMHGNVRQKDEVIIPIGGLAGPSVTGSPSIVQMYLSSNSTSNPGVAPGTRNANLYVVFDEPVFFGKNSANLTITIANTAGGNNVVARCNTSIRDIINANNTAVFKFKAGTPGTYKVQAQVIGTHGSLTQNLVSLNSGNEKANTKISGAVSNVLSTFVL